MSLRLLTLLLMALARGLTAAESTADSGENTDDVDGVMIQGTWRLIRAEQGGQATPAETMARLKVVFTLDDGSYTLDGPVKDHGLYVCDDQSDPKTVDIIPAVGENKDKAIQAIYKVDGNELTICYDFAQARPADFSTAASDTLFMAVYKRQ